MRILILIIIALISTTIPASAQSQSSLYQLIDGVIYADIDGEWIEIDPLDRMINVGVFEFITVEPEEVVFTHLLMSPNPTEQRAIVAGYIDREPRQIFTGYLSGLFNELYINQQARLLGDIIPMKIANAQTLEGYFGTYTYVAAVETPDGIEAGLYAQQSAAVGVSTVFENLSAHVEEDGSYTLPTIDSYEDGILTITLIDGTQMRLQYAHPLGYQLVEFVTPLENPVVELHIPDISAEETYYNYFEPYHDLEEAQVTINDRLYKLPIYGKYLTGMDTHNRTQHVFLTFERVQYRNDKRWGYTLYALDYSTFKLTVLYSNVIVYPETGSLDDGHLYLSESQMRITPDDTRLIFTGFNYTNGVSLWEVNLMTEEQSPRLLDEWLPYAYEYGSMPWFVSHDDTSFTLETYVNSPAPHFFYRGDIRTYDWDGNLLMMMEKFVGDATDPAYYLRGEVLYGDDGTGEVVISDGVTGQVYTAYVRSNQTWENTFGGMVVGRIEGGLPNFTIGFPSYQDGEFSVVNKVFRGQLADVPLSSWGRIFHSDTDNYVWVGIMNDINPDSATVYYLEGDVEFPIVTGLAYSVTPGGEFIFPTVDMLHGESVTITTIDGVTTTYDIRQAYEAYIAAQRRFAPLR